VGSLLNKKSEKYDIFLYYASYTKEYGPHLLNLEEWIPKEHINMYDPGTIKRCLYNDIVVSLVIYIYIYIYIYI